MVVTRRAFSGRGLSPRDKGLAPWPGYGGPVSTPQVDAAPPRGPSPSAAVPTPFARLVRVPRTGSTNADVARALLAAPDPDAALRQWPHLSVLVTDHQAAGRGRAGRGWETPAGTSLTASVVLRPTAPVVRWSWLSLLGGLAVASAIEARTGLRAGLKWPNDVLLLDAGERSVPGWGCDRKVCGVLAEVVRPPATGAPGEGAGSMGGAVVVLGFGVNVHQEAPDLPVPWATSLAAAGAGRAEREMTALLGAVGAEISALVAAWDAAGGDPVASGLGAAMAASCVTLGRDVRVLLPGGSEVAGQAVRLADDGALAVRPADGPEVLVAAGDVDHIRALTV